jgi:type VI secretion system ImpM family protein
MRTASAAGFYGKLPCKGDFLQRRVTQEFLDRWDAWLQQCLMSSREKLQERWLDAYLTSPVWRFALADGVCGSGAYAGVMVPSVDRVGRYFPLTLVAQLNTEDCLLEVASDPGRQWFDSAESLALGALEAHDLDLAAFDDQVAALGTPLRDPEAGESAYLRSLMQQSQFAHRPGQWQVPLQDMHSLQRAANAFASRELERALRPLALWWTDGSEAIAPCWLCNRGMPSPASFVAMIAGGWDDFGWESLGPPDAARSRTFSAADAVPGPATVEEIASPLGPVAIAGRHAAIARRQDAAPRSYFVSRPAVGLWGVSCSNGHEAGSAAAQTLADALHEISTAGSLTSLAEEVRRALEAVHRQRTRSASYTAAEAGAVVFLARANECAVVCAGPVQALRVRSSEVTSIEGASEWVQTDGDRLPPAHVNADTSLFDLIAAPAASAGGVVVHYDTLWSGDVWVLAGVLLFGAQLLTTLPALLAEHRTVDDATLAAVQRLAGPASGLGEDELPLMLLAAAPVQQR